MSENVVFATDLLVDQMILAFVAEDNMNLCANGDKKKPIVYSKLEIIID